MVERGLGGKIASHCTAEREKEKKEEQVTTAKHVQTEPFPSADSFFRAPSLHRWKPRWLFCRWEMKRERVMLMGHLCLGI